MSHADLHLLPREALLRTGAVDHAEWVFRPILGRVMRMRFRVVQSLLAGISGRRLLEIGYGSGILMPELARYCDELYGIDIHTRTKEVASALVARGVSAHLHSGSIEETPFENGFFNAIVAVSAIEFVDDLVAACREIQRILAPNGKLIVVTPGHSPLLDCGLRMVTGENPGKDYGDRRQTVLPTLLAHFREEQQVQVPRFLPRRLRLYAGLCLRQKS